MGCGRHMCKDPDIYSSLPLLLYTTPAPYQGHQSGVGGGKHNFVEYPKAVREGIISTLPAQAVTGPIMSTLAAPS